MILKNFYTTFQNFSGNLFQLFLLFLSLSIPFPLALSLFSISHSSILFSPYSFYLSVFLSVLTSPFTDFIFLERFPSKTCNNLFFFPLSNKRKLKCSSYRNVSEFVVRVFCYFPANIQRLYSEVLQTLFSAKNYVV